VTTNQSDAPKLHYAFIALIDKAGGELCSWLEKHLFRFAGNNWWKKNAYGVLNSDEQQKIESQGWTELQDFDVHLLLKILDRNYSFLKGKLRLPNDGRDLIYEVRQVRNRCIGHRPIRGHDPEQLARDIRTLESFCTTILGASLLAKEFRELLQSRPQPEPAAKTVAAGTSPPSSAQTSAQPQGRTGITGTEAVSLAGMFTGVELTVSQQHAIKSIETFLTDERQDCFVLKGYAGTGKTFLIGGIVKYLTACHKTTVLMAPTGRAAHVMKERHRIPASTIHRQIYALDRLKEFKEVDENGAVTFKFYFELRNNDAQHDTVFIVDEASMVSDVYTEAEFMRFGTGRLLRDLLEYINFDGNDYRKKIVFVGDNAQLPPVDMNFSPALDEKYLEKYVHSEIPSAELTHIVRQKEGDTILRNATALRDMLKSNNFASFEFESDGVSVMEAQPDRFISNYLKHVDSAGTATTVILGYSNALVKDYNASVRAHLFPNGRLLEPGDRVMLVKNNYRYEIDLFNGQAGTVISVGDTEETRTVFINAGLDENGERRILQVTLTFRDATIKFESLDGTEHDIRCKYIEDLLSSAHRDLSSEQSKALYVDFKKRNPNLHPNNPDFRETLIADPYFNALQLKYAYAVTCNKAQGGEWPTVYVDFQCQNKLEPMAVRWSYTALTRAAKNIVATNALHHNALVPLRQRNLHAAQSPPPTVSRPVCGAQPVGALPDFVGAANSIDQQIFSRLKNLLPEGFSIIELTSRTHLAQWTISKGADNCLIKIHYNGRRKISSVMLDRGSAGDWVNPLRTAVQQLINVQLSATPLTEQPALHSPEPSDSSTHESFFARLQARCHKLNMRILTTEHLTAYHSRCMLEAGVDLFSVNYHFNARQQFTSFIPENGLPDRILQILDNLHSDQRTEPLN
jgi:hypothetical protein